MFSSELLSLRRFELPTGFATEVGLFYWLRIARIFAASFKADLISPYLIPAEGLLGGRLAPAGGLLLLPFSRSATSVLLFIFLTFD